MHLLELFVQWLILRIVSENKVTVKHTIAICKVEAKAVLRFDYLAVHAVRPYKVEQESCNDEDCKVTSSVHLLCLCFYIIGWFSAL